MLKLAQILVLAVVMAISGCKESPKAQILKFATSAEYPPFEYKTNGELRGFDVDLAKLVAKQLGKEAFFEDMQFSTILPRLQTGQVDAAIATITVTPERAQHFDFSHIYHFDAIAVIYKNDHPIQNKAGLVNKKIACQLGSTLEIWLKKNGFAPQVVAVDNNNQAVEALKAGHVDAVVIDRAQGQIYSKKNTNLSFQVIDQSEDGYAIVVPKGSPLLAEINDAIVILKQKGEIAKLEEKWLQGDLP